MYDWYEISEPYFNTEDDYCTFISERFLISWILNNSSWKSKKKIRVMYLKFDRTYVK